MALPTPTILSHDFTLGDGTTTLGLTCLKDKNGRPLLERLYSPTLAEQQFTALSEAAYPASQQVIEVIEDFSKGFGKQFWVPKRYLQSLGVDASFPNILIPGPVGVASTFTIPTYSATATIANGGFEDGNMSSWTVVTQGSDANWAASSQAASIRTGSYGARVDSDSGTNPEIKQKLTAAGSPNFIGLTLTVSAYGKADVSANTTLTLNLKDENGTVIQGGAAVNMVVGAWTEATVAHTFTDSWKELWVHIVFTPGVANEFCRLDDITVTVTGSISTAADMGTVVKLVEFNAVHYAISNTGIWKRSAANWTRVAGSPVDITDAASDGTSLYLARGTSKNYWYMATGETFTRNTGTGASSQPIRMAWIAGAMYGTDDPQTVWKYSTLSSGATSNTYTVGDVGYNITSILDHLSVPTIVKENGAYQINSAGTVVTISPEIRTMFNANTGKQAMEWWGNLYFPAGLQALWEYDAGDVASVGPGRKAERLADFAGQVVAIAGDEEWLYVILDNGANIEILKGREETIDSETAWRWHPFFEVAYTTAAYAFISSITAKRLWFGGGTGLPNYIPLPDKYGDPLADTNLTFKTGETWESGWITFKEAGIPKTFKTVEIQSTGLTTGYTVTVEYDIDDGNGYVELGGSGNGVYNTSPTQTKSFASSVSGRRVKLRLTLTVASSTTGIGVFKVIITAVRNPTRLGFIVARVRVKDDDVLRNGANDSDQSYIKVAAQLHAWASTEPLTLIILGVSGGLIAGLSYTVKFDETYPHEQFVNLGDPESGQGMESEFDLRFLVTP